MVVSPIQSNLTPARRNQVLKPTSIQIERELEVLSQIMDNQFRLPVLGWRFGLNAIIDLIPEFGDIITTIVALYILVSAVRYRVPKITLLRMGLTIAIYFVGGLIPFIGYLFDVWWKPNVRNLKLLRERATVSKEQAKRGRTSDWVFVGLIIGTVAALLAGSIVLTISVWWYIATHLQFGM
ncbi:MAG TPA: DUF4112 domain-containing protein [Pyrinomonadaceae bacterium]|jgi:hypothetical protein